MSFSLSHAGFLTEYPNYLRVLSPVAGCRGGTFPTKTRPLINVRLSASAAPVNRRPCADIQIHILRKAETPFSSPLSRIQQAEMSSRQPHERQLPPSSLKKEEGKNGGRTPTSSRQSRGWLTVPSAMLTFARCRDDTPCTHD